MKAAGKGDKAAQKGEAKRERSTGHNPEECPVCMTVFDDTVQRPCTLPCGHTVCTLCVNKLKQRGHVACPECRVCHAVPEGGQFPVCYALEAFIRRAVDAEEAAAAASPPPSAGTGKGAAGAAGLKEAAGLSKKMRSFLQEQEASVVAAITACQEVQAQLDQYQTTMRGWGEYQQHMENRLQGLLDQSRSARELVRQEESRAAAKKEEATEWERQLHAALETLRTPATDKEVGVVVVEAVRYIGEAEQVLEECRESFPDANTAVTVRKVREASYAALEAFQAALKKNASVPKEELLSYSEEDCSIIGRLYAIAPPSLKAKDIRSPTQTVRRLMETGCVFAIGYVELMEPMEPLQRRHGKISLQDGKLYLHNFKKGPLPPSAWFLKMSEVLPPSGLSMVFLDLSLPGSAPRRVYVHLVPDTPVRRPMELQFIGMEVDTSYAGACLFKVVRKGQPGESVYCGYKVTYKDEYGDTCEPDDSIFEHPHSGKAGTVCCLLGYCDGFCTLFSISTRGSQDGTKNGFGEVVQGLDIVVEAVQHTPITDVIIQDCGAVL